MSGAVISSNTSLKVNRAISSTTTVNANSYAEVDYYYSSDTLGTSGNNIQIVGNIKRTFGAGQTIPSTITTTVKNGAASYTITYSIASGVEFINSP